MKANRYQYILLYLFFCALSLFLYRHCVHAHFLDDSLSAFYDYKLQGSSGFWNSFGFPSLYYGHDLFYFGFYFLFGLDGLAWHLLFIGLFCLNAVFVFAISDFGLRFFGFSRSRITAFIACLFFLVSPYQTENFVWVATLHYQISMLCLFTGMYLIIRNRHSLLWLHCFYAVSLMTLEISLVFPGIWSITYLLFRKSWLATVQKIVLPHALLILLYFIAMKLLRGYFIPHYGVEHLQGWSPVIIASTFLKYLVKIFGFTHFLSYPMREKIYGWCDLPLLVFTFWGTLATVLATLRFKSNYKREAGFVAVLLVFVFLLLMPVLNMYFMFLSRVENDRLSFFATPFLYLIQAFILTRFPYYVFVPVSAAILVVMKKLLGLYTWYWMNAAEVQQRTLDSYHWFDKQKVYILNLPQNFGGAYIYRRQWRFGGAMLVKKDKNILNQIKSVAGQNMFDMNDGVVVARLDSLTYDVSKIGDGWFWDGPLGAVSYETEDYTFTLHDYSYTLQFKRALRPDEAIIFHRQGVWEEVPSLKQ